MSPLALASTKLFQFKPSLPVFSLSLRNVSLGSRVVPKMKAPFVILRFVCPGHTAKILLALSLVWAGSLPGVQTPTTSGPRVASVAPDPEVVRPAAVAGLFYPKEPKRLAETVDRCLAEAPANTTSGVRALICPHAGYEFSGPVAGYSYKQITGASFETVIILAASHYAWFEGACVPATSAYETPLGRAPVSEKAQQLGKQKPFVIEPRCQVQRPPWSGASSRTAPSAGDDTPETWEHSIEVQVPFLQRTLKRFKILPVMFGNADPAEVAKALAPLIDEKTLVIASTDLSHYHRYDEARTLDRQTLKWVCDQNISELQSAAAEERACGRMPVLTLLHLAKLKGWQPELLDYRNSGDTAGDKARVVGYGAVVFRASEDRPSAAAKDSYSKSGAQFTATERKFLLDLARQTLTRATAGGALPEPAPESVPVPCRARKGCFVTLTKAGELRGCIGNILPTGPLHQSVIENARNAALRDPRFPPVSPEEAPKLHIEVSVLTVPEPLDFASPEDLLGKIQPGRDGVVLKIDGHSATFLPQVWEQLPDKTEFFSHLAAKAGCAPSAWRGKGVSVSRYRVEAFEESK
jgi:MEMO1 family protein